ncbi:succinate dehydrogenase [ubiquinone] cytochrome b small subunit, mitochondrial-like [Aedes albopictus]|uniref:Succinate dehydrogenase [ubiquinone] cytochrome b small subunit n=1 Tax=Aedes albopictus TaxID=7160 RepID=A0ABM1ZHM3_AEDAL
MVHLTPMNAKRVLSVILLGIFLVALMFSSQADDTLSAVSIVIHQYWVLKVTVTDYVHPILFEAAVPKICHDLLLVVSATNLEGQFYFIHNDISIAIRKIWLTKPKP